MAMESEFGTIEKVDLRDIWAKEDRHFTPWLGENLHKISDVLSIPLELLEFEAPIGNHKLDILARDLNTDGRVVIENQLEDADHDHQGRLLTYAASFDASVVVWISRMFKDEHKKAIDYLNRRTGKNTAFFGLEINVIRINDSTPALNFNIAVAPIEWCKTDNAGLKTMNAEFINRLSGKLKDHELPEATRPNENSTPWRVLNFPKRQIRYAAIWHQGKPGFEMVIERDDPDWNLQLFRELKKHQEEIESKLAPTEEEECFRWEPQGKLKRSRIAIYRPGNVYNNNKKTWDEIQEWMIRKARLFREVFDSRLDELVD